MAEKRKLSFLLFLSLGVGLIKAMHSKSECVHAHTHNTLGIVGMVLSG